MIPLSTFGIAIARNNIVSVRLHSLFYCCDGVSFSAELAFSSSYTPDLPGVQRTLRPENQPDQPSSSERLKVEATCLLLANEFWNSTGVCMR